MLVLLCLHFLRRLRAHDQIDELDLEEVDGLRWYQSRGVKLLNLAVHLQYPAKGYFIQIDFGSLNSLEHIASSHRDRLNANDFQNRVGLLVEGPASIRLVVIANLASLDRIGLPLQSPKEI